MQDNPLQDYDLQKSQNNPTEEDILKQNLSFQYYNYISLLRQTNNFQQDPQIYTNFDIQKYRNKVAFIGCLTQIALDKNDEQYLFPSITTTISQNIFQRYENIANYKKHRPIKRKLIISFGVYKKKWVIPLNKIMSICLKQKQLFIFTHLKVLFHDEKAVYFGLSNQSYIIQITTDYYKSIFKPMEIALQYNYSQLNLNKIFLEDFPKNTKFSAEQIKNKIHQNLNDMVIIGVLKKVHWDTFDALVNPKEGQVAIEVLQDVYCQKYSSAGICKIFVRFELLDKQSIRAHMQEGCVYAFLIKDAIIGQNLTVSYKLIYSKQKFLKISPKIEPKLFIIQHIFNKMRVSPLSILTYPSIMRNYYKFDVVKYQLKFFHAQTYCQQCQGSLYMTYEKEFICKGQCGKVNGKLKLWAQVIVKDLTFTAQLSIQNEHVLDFFDLHEESYILKEQVARCQQLKGGKSGISIYYKKIKEDSTFGQFNDGLRYEESQYISKLIDKLLIVFIQKKIIAIPRVNKSQNYSSFDQEIKNDVQTTFAKGKQFFKKIKLFVNGYTRSYDDQDHHIPFLKVQHVLN